MADAITTARVVPRAEPDGLLAWYDDHHRILPWRVGPAARRAGINPDPYRVWLSEVMLQQTTVAAAGGYFERFVDSWPNVHALAAASPDTVLAAWAGLGYYARARNLHRCAQIVSRDLDGQFPDNEAELRALPGIGPYTSAAIAAIAFDRPAVVVDGNVERVMARLFAEMSPLPDVKVTLRGHAATLTPDDRPGDYAQAVMDLGATVCTPVRPACGICPWQTSCRGRAAGVAEALPIRPAKPAKPLRRGYVWVALDPRHRVACVRRPDSGLLGGMLALPTSDWSEAPRDCPPFGANWAEIGEVRHAFTHFSLHLAVRFARVRRGGADFRPLPEATAAMPTVFAKACRLAASHIAR